MFFFSVVASGLYLLSGITIKAYSGDNLNAPGSLCSFKKSEDLCLCGYQTDIKNNFPVFHADCTKMRLENFPRNDQFDNVQHLDLSHNAISALDFNINTYVSYKILSVKLCFNQISYISQGFFTGVPNLLELDLSHNELAKFSNMNIFQGLKNLRTLNLSFNKLSTLPEGIFSHMPKLKVLDLRYNYLGALLMDSADLFGSRLGLSPGIIKLKLDGLGIVGLQDTFFDGAHNLKHLSLSDNPLEEIPAVPYSLDFLDLSGIDITSVSARQLNYHSLKVLKLNKLKRLEKIEHYAFYNLQALEELHMSDCRKLQEFSELAFGVIVNNTDWPLRKISLARNGLRGINSTYLHLFDKMPHVDLQSNPWNCDCNILWLQELNGSLFRGDNLRCMSPHTLMSKKVMELSETSMPTCFKGENYTQKILISILGSLVAILAILIVYLLYLGPLYYQNKYRGIGPESPYHGNTIGIIPSRAESLG